MAALSAAALASSLAFASGAQAALLYDQLANLGAPVASSDEPGGNPATEFADDFVVPPGQTWTINALNVYDNGHDPTTFNVYVYSNGAGVPGTELTSRLGILANPVGPERSIDVTPTITLGPGTYWLVVQADDDGWLWARNTVVTGSSAAWKTEQPATSCTGVFMPLATCLGGNPADAAFRIGGTSQPISGSVPPASTPLVTPATPTPPTAAKRCKKKRRAGAAAKKCRRKRGR